MYIKKTLSFVLILALTATALPALSLPLAYAANEEPVPYISYEINEDRTAVTITGCDGSVNGSVVLPAVIEDLPVTRIAANAFTSCGKLTGITVPENVTDIGGGAFSGCSSLAGITLPDGLISIGNKAFLGCTALKTLLIPASVTKIGYFAFGYQAVNVLQPDFLLFCYADGAAKEYAEVCLLNYEVLPLTDLSVKTPPVKTVYTVDETFDPTGLELTVIDHDGNEKTVSSGYTCSTAAFTNAGAKTITVTYGDRTTLIPVTVNPAPRQMVVKYSPIKTEYYTGDTLDTTGLTLLVVYSEGMPGDITEGFTCSPTTLNEAGTQTVTVTYNGLTANFDVTVTPLSLTKLELNTPPNKTEYHVGGKLDTTGLTLSATYNSGKTETVSSGFTCSPTTFTTAGKQTVTVTYMDWSVPFDVTVSTVSVSSVKLNKTSADLTIGTTLTLTAAVSPSDATNKALSWTSSNTGVATVSSKGVVTAKAAGRATVTCKAKDGSGKYATCSLLVYPAAPASPKAASASYNSIKVSWTAVTGATGYIVYRASSSAGSYTKLATITGTSYTDKSLSTGKTYFYVVCAYTLVGKEYFVSDSTAVLSAKPVPAVPASFAAAKTGSTSVKLTWKAVTGATGYAIYRATSSTGSYTYLKSTSSLSYTDTGLTKNTTYYYKVRAYTTVNGTKVFGAYTAVKSAKPS